MIDDDCWAFQVSHTILYHFWSYDEITKINFDIGSMVNFTDFTRFCEQCFLWFKKTKKIKPKKIITLLYETNTLFTLLKIIHTFCLLLRIFYHEKKSLGILLRGEKNDLPNVKL